MTCAGGQRQGQSTAGVVVVLSRTEVSIPQESTRKRRERRGRRRELIN